MSHYKDLQDDTFDWSNVRFPVGHNEIGRFEENNKGLIAMNVLEPVDAFSVNGTIRIKSVGSTNTSA